MPTTYKFKKPDDMVDGEDVLGVVYHYAWRGVIEEAMEAYIDNTQPTVFGYVVTEGEEKNKTSLPTYDPEEGTGRLPNE